MDLPGSAAVLASLHKEDGITGLDVTCPFCGKNVPTIVLQPCDGKNKLVLCPHCNGCCAIAISLIETTQILQNRAASTIFCDGIDTVTHGGSFPIPGGKLYYAIAWYLGNPLAILEPTR